LTKTFEFSLGFFTANSLILISYSSFKVICLPSELKKLKIDPFGKTYFFEILLLN